MANIKRANASGITKPGTAIADVPDAPTIGTATGGQAAATVTYTAAATGGTATTFTATSTPGSITGTGASPITISGLTNGTAYSFTVTASNSTGTSPASSASNQVTPISLGDMDPIAMVQVGSAGTSSITFSSIPATYTHLQIRGLFGASSSGQAYSVNFNSDTNNNYAYHYIAGQGSSAFTGASINRAFTLLTDTSGSGVTTSPTAFVMDLLDYTSTSKNKTMRTLIGNDANGSGQVYLVSGLWFATPAAITSISIAGLSSATFTQYSSFALYGIKGA